MGGVDLLRSLNMVGVAQLVRVSDCGSEGRRFESGLPPHEKRRFVRSAFFYCIVSKKVKLNASLFLLPKPQIHPPQICRQKQMGVSNEQTEENCRYVNDYGI